MPHPSYSYSGIFNSHFIYDVKEARNLVVDDSAADRFSSGPAVSPLSVSVKDDSVVVMVIDSTISSMFRTLLANVNESDVF